MLQGGLADYIGFLAAGFVLISTSVSTLKWIRFAALASNLFFITYALMINLLPVLALHAILLPINSWHVWRWIFGGSGAGVGSSRQAQSERIADQHNIQEFMPHTGFRRRHQR